MSQVVDIFTGNWTAVDLVERFGAIPLHRVWQENDTLDGGDVLPGFRLPLADLFAEPAGPAVQ
jgi:hypothetical protein